MRTPLVLIALVFSLSSHAQTLKIVTSIHPLLLITSEITHGLATPSALMPSGSSPHHYQLRPSEAALLHDADLLIWVGPELEGFLHKTVESLTATTTVLQLLPSTAPHKVPVETAYHDRHAHSEEHQHTPEPRENKKHEHEHEHEHHNHSGRDPHLWLAPENGVTIAERMASILSQLDPANADKYEANLIRFTQTIDTVDAQLEEQLATIKSRGYFVFHDAYQAFEQHYGLNHLGAFTLNPDRSPGARQLMAIRDQITQGKAVCVFSEPQFSPKLVDTVTSGLTVGKATLDPLGQTATSYAELLRNLGDQFFNCLSSIK